MSRQGLSSGRRGRTALGPPDGRARAVRSAGSRRLGLAGGRRALPGQDSPSPRGALACHAEGGPGGRGLKLSVPMEAAGPASLHPGPSFCRMEDREYRIPRDARNASYCSKPALSEHNYVNMEPRIYVIINVEIATLKYKEIDEIQFYSLVYLT